MRVMIISAFDGQVSEAARLATAKGAKVTMTATMKEALDLLRKGQSADLLFIDIIHDVESLVKQLQAEHFNIPIVACGIQADPERAAAAIRAGAIDYIPFPPEAEMIAAILSAISNHQYDMIARDPVMVRWIEMADKVAPSEANILITGESGTGKEVMARYIHTKSNRSKQPFISVNCAAIPENLLESELFGHEKGAFTGALARRIGKFEEANGGTLLLDEISEMDIRLQAKLLRAIQERVIDRVGGTDPVKVNIRIIATSNRDLVDSCKKGVFREDLFYRLNVINLQLPPLRQRPKDVEALASFFVDKFTELNNLSKKTFSSLAHQALINYPWPGNVRELENTIHRAVLLSSGDLIEASDLFDQVTQESLQVTARSDVEKILLIGRTVASVEKELILNTLDHCSGNRTHAANILGISIRTLRNKLKEYGEASEMNNCLSMRG
ncbi:sigma-54 dependent transcriptional regulator [Candidatus Odyssella acanthamoebae]|uniref:ATPase AAA n=1 Tax=Candidatus Odyssella acanthamoebae TaxID=91604 RepID=A0A077AX17_9PROT|nr:sigma-54 dependent transcriptional regulator [Candidatus Paracaedibacter acanthamoebae]AIK96524.1 ATPase AAA [Candidatus Paracaedibacter acanthamoebae]